MIEPEAVGADLAQQRRRVRDDHDQLALAHHRPHALLALGAERAVTGAEHLVEDEDLRLEGAGPGEPELLLERAGLLNANSLSQDGKALLFSSRADLGGEKTRQVVAIRKAGGALEPYRKHAVEGTRPRRG